MKCHRCFVPKFARYKPLKHWRLGLLCQPQMPRGPFVQRLSVPLGNAKGCLVTAWDEILMERIVQILPKYLQSTWKAKLLKYTMTPETSSHLNYPHTTPPMSGWLFVRHCWPTTRSSSVSNYATPSETKMWGSLKHKNIKPIRNYRTCDCSYLLALDFY